MKKSLKFCGGILGALLTALVLLFSFWAEGMFPFGRGTVSWCDMNQQLIPLFCDFKDILNGSSSLFLNFQNASGMNFYGVFFFFLSSPFTFSVAFVEKADIPFLMNILVVLKLCVAAFTASFVLGKTVKSLNCGLTAALGSTYALCGYAMLFYQNIMWLDMMYLFPLVVLGAYRLAEENRPYLLLTTLTLSVIFNFYISFMVFLFVIFFFGVFALFYPKHDRKIYVNLGLCGGFSLLISAFVWVPCLLQYMGSARGNSFLEEIKDAEFFAPYETTLIVLLCSGVVFAGLFLLLPRFSVAEKETKFLSTVFLLTALPLIIEPVNLMWHMGSYMSFPARYGFIPVFLGILIAAKEIKIGKEGGRWDLSIPLCFTVGLIAAFAVLFTGKNVDTLSVYINSLWSNQKALEGLTLICIFFSVCAVLIFVFLKKGNIKRGFAGLLLCIVVASQGLCSTQIFILSAKDNISIYNYQGVISLNEKADKEGFYRVNTTHKITDANMTGAAGFNSISHYTSLNDQTFMETAKMLGYSGYWMETGNWGGSILSDALLSVGYTAHRTNGEYGLRENPYYLGLGIKAVGEIPQKLSHRDRLFTLGEAFSQMTGIQNLVESYDYNKARECTVKATKEGVFVNNIAEVGTIEYNLFVGSPQTLYFDCYGGFSTNLTEKINRSMAVYVNSELIENSYPTQDFNGLLNLGHFENQQVDITIKVLETVDCTSFGVWGVREDLLNGYVQNAKTLDLTAQKGKIEGNAEKGNYFISLPYSGNYRVTLNGEKLEYTKALNGFIAVDIPNDGQLKITFTPNGFYVGAVLSAIGLSLASALILLRKKNMQYSEKIKNIIYGIFLGGCSIALLWVYIIPIIVNLSNFRI